MLDAAAAKRWRNDTQFNLHLLSLRSEVSDSNSFILKTFALVSARKLYLSSGFLYLDPVV